MANSATEMNRGAEQVKAAPLQLTPNMKGSGDPQAFLLRLVKVKSHALAVVISWRIMLWIF